MADALPPLPDRPAVFLDFDGTLVAIVDRPELVTVADPLKDLLSDLHGALGGALAIVSGRTIADLDHFLAPLGLPAAGLHGQERRTTAGGPVETAPDHPDMAVLRERLLADGLIAGGVRLEDKRVGLAVHYREAPAREADVVAAMEAAIGDLPHVQAIRGKMVVEAKPAGVDKGTAVHAFMERPPFRGRTPVFVGDDVTDEDGFRAVRHLDGITVKVGPGPTIAAHRLPDVAAVHAWLGALARVGAEPSS